MMVSISQSTQDLFWLGVSEGVVNYLPPSSLQDTDKIKRILNDTLAVCFSRSRPFVMSLIIRSSRPVHCYPNYTTGGFIWIYVYSCDFLHFSSSGSSRGGTHLQRRAGFIWHWLGNIRLMYEVCCILISGYYSTLIRMAMGMGVWCGWVRPFLCWDMDIPQYPSR